MKIMGKAERAAPAIPIFFTNCLREIGIILFLSERIEKRYGTIYPVDFFPSLLLDILSLNFIFHDLSHAQ